MRSDLHMLLKRRIVADALYLLLLILTCFATQTRMSSGLHMLLKRRLVAEILLATRAW